MRLRIWGDDMGIKDNIDLYIVQYRQVADGFDFYHWKEDSDWVYVASWSRTLQ
jgi:hypothetical protein